MMDGTSFDVIIVGCGVAGLTCALNLPEDMRIAMFAKGSFEESDSMLAQGGVCVMVDDEDYDGSVDDTMKAGHGCNRRESVEVMVSESRDAIAFLLAHGVRFDRNEDGSLHFTREGAHGRPRICHARDKTGREITSKLLDAAQTRGNIAWFEHTEMTDLVEREGACGGVIARNDRLGTFATLSSYCVLATGGIGGLYERSTNFPLLTGDGCRIARAHGVALADMDRIQFHPTGLCEENATRTFLISESTRGEGAILLDDDGNRFTDELQPRDVVTQAIRRQMEKTKRDHVWLSFARMHSDEVRKRFPTIYEHCLAAGFDITSEPIPVAPVQHYFMGGIDVDLDSRTSMPRLYAVGETSCNGVHGANRLASNSLLESIVFSRRAAMDIAMCMRRDGNAPSFGNALECRPRRREACAWAV